MSEIAIAGVVFACVFGSALLGLFLRAMLPDHHLSPESKDVVKLAMGLIATMAALVLGLLTASAKSSFDLQNAETVHSAANIIRLTAPWHIMDRRRRRFAICSNEPSPSGSI